MLFSQVCLCFQFVLSICCSLNSSFSPTPTLFVSHFVVLCVSLILSLCVFLNGYFFSLSLILSFSPVCLQSNLMIFLVLLSLKFVVPSSLSFTSSLLIVLFTLSSPHCYSLVGAWISSLGHIPFTEACTSAILYCAQIAM